MSSKRQGVGGRVGCQEVWGGHREKAMALAVRMPLGTQKLDS